MAAIRAGRTATCWLRDEPPASERRRGLFAGAPAKFASKTDADPVVELALLAAEESVADSRLDLSEVTAGRVGCVVGTSKGLLASYASNFLSGSTAEYPGFRPSEPAIQVARRFNTTGPCLCPISACATGLQSIARGADLIGDGHCDVVLAGSSDASVCDWVLSSFSRLGVLAGRFTSPGSAVRPFDQGRDGFLVGEGAAILVLERAEQAAARGARSYGTWVGSISAADPTGITQVEESGLTLATAIARLLAHCDLSARDVDFLNLHGTGTVPNDACESHAIERVFGDLPVTGCSFKAALGHCLGAAGSIELAVSLLCQDGTPGQMNLRNSITSFALTGSDRPWQTQLKTSLGFGGHLQAAIIARH